MLLYNYITRAKRAKSNPKPAYYNREADSLIPRLSLLRAKTAYDLLPPRRYIWAREGGHHLTPELRSGHRLVDTVAVYLSLPFLRHISHIITTTIIVCRLRLQCWLLYNLHSFERLYNVSIVSRAHRELAPALHACVVKARDRH